MTSNRQLYDNAQFGSLREQLRHEWKALADEWVRKENRASEFEEGRKILLSEAQCNLMDDAEASGKKLSVARAEMEARTSKIYREYVRKMHDARHAANQAKMDRDNADRKYWEVVGMEANARAERKGG